jgi:hypothetical protein
MDSLDQWIEQTWARQEAQNPSQAILGIGPAMALDCPTIAQPVQGDLFTEEAG